LHNLEGDATCNHCAAQTASSTHWLPQYTSVIESGLGHVDDILCTDDLSTHLPQMVQHVNKNLQRAPWISRQKTSFVLAPMNFSNKATLRARPSRVHLATNDIFSKRELLSYDIAGRAQYAHPLLANLYFGDFKLNPCARPEPHAVVSSKGKPGPLARTPAPQKALAPKSATATVNTSAQVGNVSKTFEAHNAEHVSAKMGATNPTVNTGVNLDEEQSRSQSQGNHSKSKFRHAARNMDSKQNLIMPSNHNNQDHKPAK
ncbi:MAG: hypothetical protein SGPRY_014029, partial [Prymnesium sp.]